jgi:hypothetical protein
MGSQFVFGRPLVMRWITWVHAVTLTALKVHVDYCYTTNQDFRGACLRLCRSLGAERKHHKVNRFCEHVKYFSETKKAALCLRTIFGMVYL